MQGAIGFPPDGWPKVLQKIVLDSAGIKPITGRAGAKLPKADFAAVKKELAGKIKHEPRDTDVPVSYTHLDVYKRQREESAPELAPDRARSSGGRKFRDTVWTAWGPNRPTTAYGMAFRVARI